MNWLSWIWDDQKGWKTDLQAEWWGTGSPADKSNPTMKIPSPTPRALLTPRTLGVRWITLGLTLKDPFAIQHDLGIWCIVELSLPWQLCCIFRENINEKKRFLLGIARMRGVGLPMPQFFGPFSRSAFLVNKKSLFLQKCIELLTVF